MTNLSVLRQLPAFVLNLVYPPRCAACRKAGSSFCPDCREKLTYLTPPLCPVCGYPQPAGPKTCHQCRHNPQPDLDAIRSAAFFDDSPLRKAIHRLKYQNEKSLAAPLATLLAECYHANNLHTEVIVPVPLHQARYKERGYNQSTLLARALSQILQQPVDDKTLIRHRVTQSQMTLKAQERQVNVKDAFSCRSANLANKTVLLIDDVCTTGATLNACAQALKTTGVSQVYGLTLARAV